MLEAVGIGLVVAVAGCGGGNSDHLVAPPDPPVLTTLSVTLSAPTVYVGSSVTASATGADQRGASIATGTVAWSTGTPGVATVGSDGKVTAVAPGTTTVLAAAGTKQAQATLTVKQLPVARVNVLPASASIVPGATQQLTVATLDPNGNVLTGRTVVWTSSDTAKAKVDSTGLVTGISIGNATVTATSETQSDSSAISVIAPPPPGGAPTILSISPAVLTPGATVTITGTGFSATPAADTLTVDSMLAVVTGASATQLTAKVPTTMPCTPTHGAAVQVTVGGFSATRTQTLRTGTPETLAVGGSVVITSASALACLELPQADGDYVVSVFNDLQAPTSVAPFRLAGAVGGAATPDRAAPVMMRQALARPARASALPADLAGLPENPAMHMRVLEASRNAYAMLRGTDRVQPALSRSVAGQPAFATVPTVGTTRTFRVNQFTTTLGATGSCSSYKEITARVAYVGTKSIIWEDVTAPLAGTMDSYFTKLGQEFDSTMYRSDSTYFGDPLVTDPYTDGDHHLDMVFTPAVPTGLAGFVTACDLFPRGPSDSSSNFGEFFYAVVPTVAGTGFSGNTADAWLRGIRTTVVHEVKHIASFGARLTNHASSFEESWLEEGMAREAEEVWLRNNIYNVAWKADARYANTLYCDVRPTFSQCAGKPFGIFGNFNTLYSVLESPGASSLFGRVADNDFNFYSLAWSFSRWADDRYATSDASFLRGITQATTTTGMASISALTGQSTDDMLGHWTLSLDLDGDAAFASNPDVQFPTWNTRDIYAGMASDFPYPSYSYFPLPFPLTPVALPAGPFAVDNAGIHGGAFAMYELTTSATAGQTLSLLGAGGSGPASFSLRIAIARKQ